MDSQVQIYSYARCTTCRKALKWLEDNSINYKLIDIVESPPSKELLKEAFKQLGNRKKLFNTNGLSYRNLGSEVIKAMSDSEALEALALDGKLIKRPFLITQKGEILTGFKIDTWADILTR